MHAPTPSGIERKKVATLHEFRQINVGTLRRLRRSKNDQPPTLAIRKNFCARTSNHVVPSERDPPTLTKSSTGHTASRSVITSRATSPGPTTGGSAMEYQQPNAWHLVVRSSEASPIQEQDK